MSEISTFCEGGYATAYVGRKLYLIYIPEWALSYRYDFRIFTKKGLFTTQ